MVSELPDFVDGLVDIARRGRSLGIHLVLATQRPAGVVTADIQANTSLRIALRVTERHRVRRRDLAPGGRLHLQVHPRPLLRAIGRRRGAGRPDGQDRRADPGGGPPGHGHEGRRGRLARPGPPAPRAPRASRRRRAERRRSHAATWPSSSTPWSRRRGWPGPRAAEPVAAPVARTVLLDDSRGRRPAHPGPRRSPPGRCPPDRPPSPRRARGSGRKCRRCRSASPTCPGRRTGGRWSSTRPTAATC